MVVEVCEVVGFRFGLVQEFGFYFVGGDQLCLFFFVVGVYGNFILQLDFVRVYRFFVLIVSLLMRGQVCSQD